MCIFCYLEDFNKYIFLLEDYVFFVDRFYGMLFFLSRDFYFGCVLELYGQFLFYYLKIFFIWDFGMQLKFILQERMGDGSCIFQYVMLIVLKEICIGCILENFRLD